MSVGKRSRVLFAVLFSSSTFVGWWLFLVVNLFEAASRSCLPQADYVLSTVFLFSVLKVNSESSFYSAKRTNRSFALFDAAF